MMVWWYKVSIIYLEIYDVNNFILKMTFFLLDCSKNVSAIFFFFIVIFVSSILHLTILGTKCHSYFFSLNYHSTLEMKWNTSFGFSKAILISNWISLSCSWLLLFFVHPASCWCASSTRDFFLSGLLDCMHFQMLIYCFTTEGIVSELIWQFFKLFKIYYYVLLAMKVLCFLYYILCLFGMFFYILLSLTYKYRKYCFWVKFSKWSFYWIYKFCGSQNPKIIFLAFGFCVCVCVISA